LRDYSENVEVLLKVREELERAGDLKAKVKELERRFGTRIIKGYEAAIEGCVKKYKFMPSGRVVWIVVGKEREYLVYPLTYCHCEDFYLNVVIRGKVEGCYHIFAQMIADILKKYDEVVADDGSFFKFIKEWKKVIV